MPSSRRANGAGNISIKHGAYYGRWYTDEGGQANRKLGQVRRPGTRDGLTRGQAEKRLRELMARSRSRAIRIARSPSPGRRSSAQLEARGCARSHIETAESHLRVHLVPFFGEKALDRVRDADVTRFLYASDGRPEAQDDSQRLEHAALAVRASGATAWVTANPCKLVDAPAVPPSSEMRYLTQEELVAVIDRGVAETKWAVVDRPLYLWRP